MAKARMLHKKISVSGQVNKLSLPARLLFTWMIAHADDEGRLKGEPEYVKAIVAPMTKWSFTHIKIYLEEMKNIGLIYYWHHNNEWFIEFIKWKQHQSIKSDRFKPSDLPTYSDKDEDTLTPIVKQDDSKMFPQSNVIKSSPIKVNTSEYQERKIADKNRFKTIREIINPKSFEPNSEEEYAALDTWEKLESHNPMAFQTTYLHAIKRGLPSQLFYQFTSEIKQDPTIKNPGAVFNKKVEEYLAKKRG